MPSTSDEWTEFGAWFCTNPACALHVRVGEPGVNGRGNWAMLPDGSTWGRARYGGRMLCDRCGRAWVAGRLQLSSATEPEGDGA
jgi:hypothetical protein